MFTWYLRSQRFSRPQICQKTRILMLVANYLGTKALCNVLIPALHLHIVHKMIENNLCQKGFGRDTEYQRRHVKDQQSTSQCLNRRLNEKQGWIKNLWEAPNSNDISFGVVQWAWLDLQPWLANSTDYASPCVFILCNLRFQSKSQEVELLILCLSFSGL